MRYPIRLAKNQILQDSIGHLLTRPVGRPPNHVGRTYASFSSQAGSWDSKRRVVAKVEWHPGALCPGGGLDRFQRSSVTNLSRPAERVIAVYNQRGTAEQHIKEGKNASLWTRLSCRKFRDNAGRLQLHPGLQSRQLHADVGLAEVGGTRVSDRATGKAGEDWCESGQPWPVRHVAFGRARGAEGTVPENPEPDR